jgi:hypothetical protein
MNSSEEGQTRLGAFRNKLSDDHTTIICVGLVTSCVMTWISRQTGSFDVTTLRRLFSEGNSFSKLLLALGLATLSGRRTLQWVAATILFITAIPGAVQFSRDVNVVIEAYVTSTWYWNLVLMDLFRWLTLMTPLRHSRVAIVYVAESLKPGSSLVNYSGAIARIAYPGRPVSGQLRLPRLPDKP